MPLNPRQQRFVEELIRCGNASEAYRIAYEMDNIEASNAASARLLANVSVREALETARAAAVHRIELVARRWAEEVALLAFSDATHYAADRHGKVTTTGPPGSTRAISSIKVRQVTTGRGQSRRTTVETEIKLWSKTEALRMAGQALALLQGKLEDDAPEREPLDHLSDADLDQIAAILDRTSAGAAGAAPPA